MVYSGNIRKLLMPSTLYCLIQVQFHHELHYVKGVHIRSYSGPHFPAFGFSVFQRIQFECGTEYGHFFTQCCLTFQFSGVPKFCLVFLLDDKLFHLQKLYENTKRKIKIKSESKYKLTCCKGLFPNFPCHIKQI